MATTISRRALVVHGIDFEGFSSVTLAQAGIRGEHAPASGYSAWIPAFAGMTTQWSTSHLHSGHLLNQNAGDSYTAVTTCAAPARRSSVGLTQRSPVNRAPRGLQSPLSAEPGASAPGEKCPNVVRFDLGREGLRWSPSPLQSTSQTSRHIPTWFGFRAGRSAWARKHPAYNLAKHRRRGLNQWKSEVPERQRALAVWRLRRAGAEREGARGGSATRRPLARRSPGRHS